MKTQYLPEPTHHILTKEAAKRRSDTWQLLRKTGATLTWHPIAIDKVLNTSELRQISSIQSAAVAAVEGEPHLHNDVVELLEVLNGNVQGCPFWFGFVRPQTIRLIPPSFRGDGGLIDRCVDESWGEMCRIEMTYAPTGVDASGELRPHYYHNYLRVCLRTVIRKISRLCLDATATSMDDPSNPAQYPDPNNLAPGAGIENQECRAALGRAIQHLRRDARMEKVFNLLVIRGLSIREAGVVVGLSKSRIHRDAEALVGHLQDVFSKHYGWTPRGAPDVAAVLSAMRNLLEDNGAIRDFSSPALVAGNVVALPAYGNLHPVQGALSEVR